MIMVAARGCEAKLMTNATSNSDEMTLPHTGINYRVYNHRFNIENSLAILTALESYSVRDFAHHDTMGRI